MERKFVTGPEQLSQQIYLSNYEGWYSVRDEAFYTENELISLDDSLGITLNNNWLAVWWLPSLSKGRVSGFT